MRTYTRLSEFTSLYIDDFKADQTDEPENTVVSIEFCNKHRILEDKALLMLCNPAIVDFIIPKLASGKMDMDIFNPLLLTKQL